MLDDKIEEMREKCNNAFKKQKASEMDKLRADIDYIAMMCDIELEEGSSNE